MAVKRYFVYSHPDGLIEIVDTYTDQIVENYYNQRDAKKRCKELNKNNDRI